MDDFHKIIENYRALFTKVLMYIGSGSCFLLAASAIQPHGNFSFLSILLITNGVIFLSCGKFICQVSNYKWSAHLLVILTSLLILFSVFRLELPVMAGGFAFIPAIIAISTILCSIRVGAFSLAFFICIIVIANIDRPSSLVELGFDFDIYIDRTIASVCTFAVAAMSEYSTRMALKHIDQQSHEIHLKEKLASLGVFVGGIAHEINNPLAIMMGATRIIKQKIVKHGLEKDTSKWIQSIEQGGDRITHVIQSLLFFNKDNKSQLSHQEFNTHLAAEDALKLLLPRMEEAKIDVRKDQKNSIKIKGDLIHLSSILRIIVENSIDSLVSSAAPAPSIRISDELSGNRYTISVTDNGPGIPEAIKSKILDPFFTTKEHGRSSGMGLALAYSLCRALSWDIKFSSDSNETIFSIVIPINIA